jgi:hypothetical protein
LACSGSRVVAGMDEKSGILPPRLGKEDFYMPLNAIPFDSLSEDHLQRLVQDNEQENKIIEFKQELPRSSDADKKEFLADFTSFANTAGGDLIYGMRAQNGKAQEVVGLDGDLDAELNRLESMIGTGIQPRVTGYSAT